MRRACNECGREPYYTVAAMDRESGRGTETKEEREQERVEERGREKQRESERARARERERVAEREMAIALIGDFAGTTRCGKVGEAEKRRQ